MEELLYIGFDGGAFEYHTKSLGKIFAYKMNISKAT